MHDFREKTPVLRASPKEVKNHGEYKQELKADYYSKCGYCNDADHWTGGWRFYQLDHFVPQKYLNKISKTEYSNLVYSCFFCNNSKRAKWPSKDETVPNDGSTGFVHPGTKAYESHFKRDLNGNIIAKTELGKYMVLAMKLNLKRHGLIWNLERLEIVIDELEHEFNSKADHISAELSHKINKLLFQYRKYSKLLRAEADA